MNVRGVGERKLPSTFKAAVRIFFRSGILWKGYEQLTFYFLLVGALSFKTAPNFKISQVQAKKTIFINTLNRREIHLKCYKFTLFVTINGSLQEQKGGVVAQWLEKASM